MLYENQVYGILCFLQGRTEEVAKNTKSTEQKVDLAHLRGEQGDAGDREERLDERQDSLAARLRTGDRSAAAELVDMYYERVYVYIRRLGHDRQISEDLTQETFLQAWRHIGQLRDGRALNGWLYRIAGNVSRLYWRRRKGKEPTSAERIDVPESRGGEHDKISRNEELGQLKNAVARLPWKLRQTIVLHYMEHLTIAQAAEAAGVRQGTFKSRLNRALKVLREQVV
jgi:RNA polymerase sigma-70 factor (ECF subfamily)